MTRSSKGPVKASGSSRRDLPLDPALTVAELRAAIPKECWERSLSSSFYYAFKDLSLIILTGWAAYTLDSLPLSFPARVLLWIGYFLFQGFWGTGLWVVAHECGHRAFSTSDFINDCVGLVLHTMLLVPYHPWRISHASHHAHTGNFHKDEVHIPTTRSGMETKLPFTKFAALVRYLKSVLLGWPAYLLWNASSNSSRKGHVNHFSPSSPLFKESDRNLVILSDIALLIWCFCLYTIFAPLGIRLFILMYFLPYLHVNHWLVLITKLQHSDVDLPHYADSEWNWLRGQLTTIDRSFGWFLDTTFHHIQDTHVAHHLFPRLPHYNAEKATEALKNKLGPYYKRCEDNVVQQTIQCFSECILVEDDPADGLYWWLQH